MDQTHTNTSDTFEVARSNHVNSTALQLSVYKSADLSRDLVRDFTVILCLSSFFVGDVWTFLQQVFCNFFTFPSFCLAIY